MTAPVLKLTDAVEDVRYEDAHSTIARALKYIDDGEYKQKKFTPTGAVILLVEETNGVYRTKSLRSNLKTSEVVALLSICTHRLL